WRAVDPRPVPDVCHVRHFWPVHWYREPEGVIQQRLIVQPAWRAPPVLRVVLDEDQVDRSGVQVRYFLGVLRLDPANPDSWMPSRGPGRRGPDIAAQDREVRRHRH